MEQTNLFGSIEKFKELNILKTGLKCLLKARFPNFYTIDELNADYARFINNGKEIPFADFSFTSLRECLSSFRDVIKISADNDVVEIVADDETQILKRFENIDSQLLANEGDVLIIVDGKNKKPKYNYDDKKCDEKLLRFGDDSTLNEINTNEKIIDKFSISELKNWRSKHIFPDWVLSKIYTRDQLVSIKESSSPLDPILASKINDMFKTKSPPPSPPLFDLSVDSPSTSSSSSSRNFVSTLPNLDKTLLPDGVDVPHKLWCRIYSILQKRPDGIEELFLTIEYARIYKVPLCRKEVFNECHVKNLRELMFALPNVDADITKDGVYVYRFKQGVTYQHKYSRLDKRQKANKRTTLALAKDDEEEDDDSDYLIPPQPKEFLPKGAKIPQCLRERIYKILVTDYKEGTVINSLTEAYARRFKSSINSTRDCGMPLEKTLECMKDIIICGRNVHTNCLYVKPLPYEQITRDWGLRVEAGFNADDDVAAVEHSSSSQKIPPSANKILTDCVENKCNINAAASSEVFTKSTIPKTRAIRTKTTVKEKTSPPPQMSTSTNSNDVDRESPSKRITEHILIENLYDRLAKLGPKKGLKIESVPNLFKDVPLIKTSIEKTNLTDLFKKNTHLFHLKIVDGRCVAVRVVRKTAANGVTAPDREPSPDDNIAAEKIYPKITPEMTENELNLLHRALKQSECWIKFNEIANFFLTTYKRPMAKPSTDELKKLILQKPQRFAYSTNREDFSVRRYTTTQCAKIDLVVDNLSDDVCANGSFTHFVLECGDELDVKLSSPVQPDGFYVQISALLPSFQSITRKMNQFYVNPSSETCVIPKDFKIFSGFVCASYVDNFWYRTEIFSGDQREGYLVRCVDFGFSKAVRHSDLRFLKKEFVDSTKPVAAVRLKLAFLDPIDNDGFGEWDPKIPHVVNDYVADDNCMVTIKVVSVSSSTDVVPEVQLIVENANGTIDVNEELVRLKYAQYKPTTLNLELNTSANAGTNDNERICSFVGGNDLDASDDEGMHNRSTTDSNHSPVTPNGSVPATSLSNDVFDAETVATAFPRQPQMAVGRGRGRGKLATVNNNNNYNNVTSSSTISKTSSKFVQHNNNSSSSPSPPPSAAPALNAAQFYTPAVLSPFVYQPQMLRPSYVVPFTSPPLGVRLSTVQNITGVGGISLPPGLLPINSRFGFR